nr:Nucleotidyltransferase domain containing protein [Haemonchus contortus]
MWLAQRSAWSWGSVSSAIVNIQTSGRRHQRSLERQAQAAELPKKSVFVALTFKHNAGDEILDPKVIASAFSTFGNVTHVSCGFLQDHAFVEFDGEDAVERAKAAKSIKITETLTGVIYERRATFNDDHHGPSVDIDEVIEHVSDACCRGFLAQLDRIASCIGITEKEVQRRNMFRKRFEELLSTYVLDPNVIQFGSAVTGLGTNDSDIDLCLLFKDETPALMDEFIRYQNILLTCPTAHFEENPIHRDELSPLPAREQTEVLFRVMKEMKREKSGFFKSLYIVSDARCPVIRFLSYDRHLVELSVNNKIGCQKSAFIGALVRADQSGLLRKLILGLRLWAASNGVFSSEKKRTWNLNSYTLNLMFFSFLLSEKLLPVVNYSEEELLNGAETDFPVPSYTLADTDIRKLFKKFFVLCVERQLEKILFSLRNGGVVPLDDFKEQMTLKPQSILFVQDPIELTDNVAKNVTSKALKTMRHAMMLSLAAMKQNADSFAVMLRVLITNSTSSSPAPFLPPTEGSCRVSGFPEEFDEGTAESVLSFIVSAVLYCDSTAAPAKKPRLDSEVHHSGSFEVNKKLWMSRRALRKKWSGLLKPDEQFPLIVEALVSMSLSSTAPSDCRLMFHTFFDVYKDSLWVGLKLVEGETVDLANVAHFIDQLLTKTRDYLQNGDVGRCQMSLEEFTSQVRTIFDREKEHLK